MENKEIKIKNETLMAFAINMNQLAIDGKLDKVWGRDNEILRVCEILNRRKKNNVVLVAHPGVGKTAIVEGLVQKIVNKDVPFELSEKIVWSLDVGSITAGTQFRGQMEERLKKILNEVESNPNNILFIDEIHMILDSGSSSSAINISNIMKPYLTSGKLQVIGATTLNEYVSHFEKDGGLVRRFHKLVIDEPTIEACIDILKNCIPHYQDFHNVVYSDEIVESLPKLAKKYITDRHLPDSVIDILDEVGSRVKTSRTLPNKKIMKLQKELTEKELKKIDIIESENWELVPLLIPELKKLKEKITIETERFENEIKSLESYTITQSDILKVIASTTLIPLDKLSEDGKVNLKRLQNVLESKLIGQAEATEKVIKAIKRSILGFNNPNKPISSFLFLGKTGTGKCVTKDTFITIRNKKTGVIEKINFGEFKNRINS